MIWLARPSKTSTSQRRRATMTAGAKVMEHRTRGAMFFLALVLPDPDLRAKVTERR